MAKETKHVVADRVRSLSGFHIFETFNVVNENAQVLEAVGRRFGYRYPAAVTHGDPELLRVVAAPLRADMALFERYTPTSDVRLPPLPPPSCPPLTCALIALGGGADPPVPAANLPRWSAHTSGRVGYHFSPRSSRYCTCKAPFDDSQYVPCNQSDVRE